MNSVFKPKPPKATSEAIAAGRSGPAARATGSQPTDYFKTYHFIFTPPGILLSQNRLHIFKQTRPLPSNYVVYMDVAFFRGTKVNKKGEDKPREALQNAPLSISRSTTT